MNSVVTLTEVEENRNTHINSFGFLNQMIFEQINDALYHLFLTNPIDSIMTLKKTSDDFAWITIEHKEETKYYELRIVKPLHYE